VGEAADADRGVYRFEELGWLEFERLANGLLARHVGLDDARWFGRADEGRLALIRRDGVVSGVGPVAGPLLVVIAWSPAVARERLSDRVRELAGDAGVVPRCTLVITNAPEGDEGASAWSDALDFIPHARQLSLGPKALSAVLDADAGLRRRVPALLGVRDIAGLVETAVLDRSTAELDAARRLARVFVATRAYARTLAVLERHRFAVVTGPPEMGKTAIARMLALAKLSEGWEAHECRQPEELWRLFSRDRAQLFIADDAFGSTEYRPDAAEHWALELDRVLRATDDRHWLIWTSRPAPLKAGLARIHREHGVERFPQPAEVRVDASDLDLEEKASILFRHARSRPLTARGVELVRVHGWGIVDHPHFTPERIRRFVVHRLPELERIDAPVVRADIGEAVSAEIREPTEAMATSLAALPPEYRGLLVALLDAPPGPVAERHLVGAARRHLDAGLRHRPADLVDRLTDHFVRLVPPQRVTWVHPSWRDLVIDDLAGDPAARRRFLERCSLDGLLLALSVGGGATGARRFPLLVADADWDTATGRLAELIPALEDTQLARLLASLDAAVQAPTDPRVRSEVQVLSQRCLAATRKQLDARRQAIPTTLLDNWYTLADRLGGGFHAPRITASWIELLPTESTSTSTVADLVRIEEWLRLARVLAEHDRDALARVGFPARTRDLLEQLAHDASTVAREQRQAGRGEVLTRIARLLARIGLCREILLQSAPQPAVAWWSGPEDDPALPFDPRLLAEDWRLVARVLRDLEPFGVTPSPAAGHE
jgi:hypothetical protein